MTLNADLLDEFARRDPTAADPVLVPDESVLARILATSTTTALTSYQRRTRYGALGAAAIAAAVAIVATVLPGSPARPLTAQAALERAAGAAKRQPSVALRPGQFLYATVTTNAFAGGCWLDARVKGTNRYAGSICTTEQTQRQIWQAENGAGRERDVFFGPATFLTSRSRANWVLAGSPASALLLPGARTVSAKTSVQDLRYPRSSDSGSFTGAPVAGFRPLNVDALPTRPEGLDQFLSKQINEGGPYSIGDLHLIEPMMQRDGKDGALFATASALLGVPSVGGSAAERSALFVLMARLPGVELLGKIRDREGRLGVGIGGPVYGGLRSEVIIDTTTGRLLQEETVVAEPSRESPFTREYEGSTKGHVVYWTIYGPTEVVNSLTATR
jgi:hypothetical protein